MASWFDAHGALDPSCDARFLVGRLHFAATCMLEAASGAPIMGTSAGCKRLALPAPWPRRMRELDVLKGWMPHLTPVRAQAFLDSLADALREHVPHKAAAGAGGREPSQLDPWAADFVPAMGSATLHALAGGVEVDSGSPLVQIQESDFARNPSFSGADPACVKGGDSARAAGGEPELPLTPCAQTQDHDEQLTHNVLPSNAAINTCEMRETPGDRSCSAPPTARETAGEAGKADSTGEDSGYGTRKTGGVGIAGSGNSHRRTPVLCKFFVMGSCTRGDSCSFSHATRAQAGHTPGRQGHSLALHDKTQDQRNNFSHQADGKQYFSYQVDGKDDFSYQVDGKQDFSHQADGNGVGVNMAQIRTVEPTVEEPRVQQGDTPEEEPQERCRFGRSCTRLGCRFSHPQGRQIDSDDDTPGISACTIEVDGHLGTYVGYILDGVPEGRGEVEFFDGPVLLGSFVRGQLAEGVLYTLSGTSLWWSDGEWFKGVDEELLAAFPPSAAVALAGHPALTAAAASAAGVPAGAGNTGAAPADFGPGRPAAESPGDEPPGNEREQQHPCDEHPGDAGASWSGTGSTERETGLR